MSLVVDKMSPNFWKKLKKNSIIILKDEQTIEDSMADGKGVDGIEYNISEIINIKEQNNCCEWIIFHLEEPDDDSIKLIVKIVDGLVELKIFFEDYNAFEPENRSGIINREDYWLFKNPENPEKFDFLDLDYSQVIDWEFEEIGEFKFLMKPQGILFGQENEKKFATIAEYQADIECKNSQLFIIEKEKCSEKGKFGVDGGYIQLWIGCKISENDLDILPV